MTDVAKTKKILEDKLQELTTRTTEIDHDLGQHLDEDWEEHAVETADDEVLEKVGNVALDEIREIKLALSRLEAGTYGICARCGAKIPAARLEILPYSTKCMNCA
jgi:RNA polymerase-binding transcription factor DksA